MRVNGVNAETPLPKSRDLRLLNIAERNWSSFHNSENQCHEKTDAIATMMVLTRMIGPQQENGKSAGEPNFQPLRLERNALSMKSIPDNKDALPRKQRDAAISCSTPAWVELAPNLQRTRTPGKAEAVVVTTRNAIKLDAAANRNRSPCRR